MKFTYTGSDERTFPSISVTVKPGDSFDAPDDFSATDVTPATKNKVATPDSTVGDE
jgi:hypothetical protein